MLKSNPMKHQIEGTDFILKNNGIGALFWEIGCGKTFAALNIYSELRKENDNLKMFVLCPLSLINSAWGEDILKFSNYKYLNLNQNKNLIDSDIYIANFEYLLSQKNRELLNKLFSNDQWLCVIDESSRIKNNTAKTTKAILALKNRFKHRIIMSGTPAPNSETEYWAQISFLQDKVFHPNFYAFRNTYFHLNRGNQIIPGQVYSRMDLNELYKKGWKYSISKPNRDKLFSRISPICHFVNKKDCLDLPEQIDQIRKVEMDDVQKKTYLEMKNHAIAEIINDAPRGVSFIVAKIALTKLMKLRQITSGFAIDDQGQAKRFLKNTKLQELISTLEDIGDKQVIIWCNFHQEFNDICEVIPEDKRCMIHGEIAISEREISIDSFKSGKKQYLIANPASSGHGLTFTNCSIEIFYSMDFSYEKYEQARGRIHRLGQKNQCLYIHLICDKSIDEYIFEVVNKKKDLHQAILEFINERDSS